MKNESDNQHRSNSPSSYNNHDYNSHHSENNIIDIKNNNVCPPPYSSPPQPSTSAATITTTATSPSVIPPPNNKMYKVMEGSRAGSCIYVHDNFTYTLFREYNSHFRVRCTEWRKKSCKAFANISKIDDSFVLSKVHCHQGNEANIAMLKLKSGMKREAASTTTSLREIFDRACEDADVKASSDDLSFNKMESTLYKRRRRTQCFVPSMVQDIKEEVDDEGGGGNGGGNGGELFYMQRSYCYSSQQRSTQSSLATSTTTTTKNTSPTMSNRCENRKIASNKCCYPHTRDDENGDYGTRYTFKEESRDSDYEQQHQQHQKNTKDLIRKQNETYDYSYSAAGDERSGKHIIVYKNNEEGEEIDRSSPMDYHDSYTSESMHEEIITVRNSECDENYRNGNGNGSEGFRNGYHDLDARRKHNHTYGYREGVSMY